MNKAGFAGVLLILAIALTSTLLLTISNETKLAPSYKESLPQTELVLNNYELVLTQIAQDCGWDLTCVDTKADLLANALNAQNNINCTHSPSEDYTTSIKIKLTCSIARTNILINVNKIITIPKLTP